MCSMIKSLSHESGTLSVVELLTTLTPYEYVMMCSYLPHYLFKRTIFNLSFEFIRKVWLAGHLLCLEMAVAFSALWVHDNRSYQASACESRVAPGKTASTVYKVNYLLLSLHPRMIIVAKSFRPKRIENIAVLNFVINTCSGLI